MAILIHIVELFSIFNVFYNLYCTSLARLARLILNYIPSLDTSLRDGPFDFSWGGGGGGEAQIRKNIEHVSN